MHQKGRNANTVVGLEKNPRLNQITHPPPLKRKMVGMLDPNPGLMHYPHPWIPYTLPHPLLLRNAPLEQYGGGAGEFFHFPSMNSLRPVHE